MVDLLPDSLDDKIALILTDPAKWNKAYDEVDDPSSINLDRAHFEHNTTLDGVKLNHVSLRQTVFNNCTVKNIQFKGADLSEATFFKVRFEGYGSHDAPAFAGAKLMNADISSISGLHVACLAGADLSGASLPEQFHFDGLQSVEELSRNARTMFFILITFSVFCILSSVGFSDYELIMKTGKVVFPFVQASTDAVRFFQFAPLLLMGLYIYFHLYLSTLWRELSLLPAFATDGRDLVQKVYPWLLISLAHDHIKLIKERNKKEEQNWAIRWKVVTSRLLGWSLVPVVQFCLWLNFLVLHDIHITLYHLTIILLTMLLGYAFYVKARSTLRKSYSESEMNYNRMNAVLFLVFPCLIFILMLASSVYTVYDKESWEDLTGFDWRIADADINHAAFNVKPTSWDIEEQANAPLTSVVSDALNSTTGPPATTDKEAHKDMVRDKRMLLAEDLPEKNLQHINLNHAIAEKTYFVHCNMSNARMIGAELSEAQFQKTILTKVDFTGATLNGSDLSGAILKSTNLTDAKFQDASLFEADLTDATLLNTNFRGADLRNATLTSVKLESVKMAGARLQGAIMIDVDFRGTSFSGFDFTGCDLTGAKFQKVDLSSVNFAKAQLFNAHLDGANLTECKGLTEKQLKFTFVDGTTKLPKSLLPRYHGPDRIKGEKYGHPKFGDKKGI